MTQARPAGEGSADWLTAAIVSTPSSMVKVMSRNIARKLPVRQSRPLQP
jgi:hypothetical protein